MASLGKPTIVWLRDDLRLADNPALTAGARIGAPLVVVYVLDEMSEGIRRLGGASKWWLHGSLDASGKALAKHGQRLVLRHGPAQDVLLKLADELGAGHVFWNRRYGGGERAVDAAIKAGLKDRGIAVESFQANLLCEPWTIRTKADQPFRVFTPFWNACRTQMPPREPLPAPDELPSPVDGVGSDSLADWKLLPTRPDWAGGLRDSWTPGEDGAQARFQAFRAEKLKDYAAHRDEPAADVSSRLSPHLRFGEISPFQLWHGVSPEGLGDGTKISQANVDKFLSEIGWREFSWHLLFHQPDLAMRNFQPRFDAFPWPAVNEAALVAWRKGRTGIPIVDAGMRELWKTGFMHNRVRMIVASFLIKNLMVDWRIGEAWFWDTLVDADAANNPASWQWVAGSGADAAPYFRVFNPVLQGEKFDAAGDYVRRFVPELADVPAKQIHAAWKAGGVPGYPGPIVDLGATRERALRAFQQMREDDVDSSSGFDDD
ncbi:cryptochrome/photolyase family protein [Kaistia nematophila]|uniref:Deoxyribodipyrimidine photo-lyase n=1 Tax=Kaistia nematophila TaxID=2994654 RepID=A0A9X3DZA4_9HYPH|nr:deoxyribodipyrimidine photo-lyase [Kaistia nematophila]MCX5568605.1 deoxyribodipyrimidine photo-lyase [Kaistia nematophila]